MKTDFWVKKYCGIYCIQNKTTGMAYVGQSVDIIKRWSAHTTPGKKSSGIQKAIKEAGIESFHFFVLEICAREDLNDREIHWIKTYDCIHPKGYNGNSGGGAPTKVSDATRKKLSAPKSPEHIAKQVASQSITKKGKVAHNKGKQMSEEAKAKMSISAKKRSASEEGKLKLSAAGKEAWKKKRALKVSSESPLD